jgi:hypothetical protein
MVEAEIKYWEENEEEFWKAINTEYWKKIEGWNYSVSTEGRIINNKTNYILKPSYNKANNIDNGGYYQVTLCENNKKYYPLVHRLVAEAFIPNIKNLSDVNHKNPNERHNNSVGNLMWMSRMENTQAVNTKKENSGYIRKVGNSWNARLRYMGNEYSFCKTDKEIVEKWLNDRNYEIKNKLPLTELPQGRTNNGGVYPRGDGWRARITINGKEKTKTCKKKEDAEKWLENLK